MAETLINPVHFYGNDPPPRIIGTECEYNVQTTGSHAPKTYVREVYVKKAGHKVFREFLDNGSNLGTDVIHLVEYRSAECLGALEATAGDLAGIIVVSDVVEQASIPLPGQPIGIENNGVYRLAGSYLNQRDADGKLVNPIGNTAGYHENYLIPGDLANNQLLEDVLPTLLATRFWAMAGTVRDHYVLSQKVWGLGGEAVDHTLGRRTGHGAKPMCSIHDPSNTNDIMGTSAWARVEVRYADATLSPTGRFLGLAAVSLALRLVEHASLVGRVHLEALALVDPVQAAKDIANDLTLTTEVETKKGEKLTARALQKRFFKMFGDLSTKITLPEDEQRAIPLLDSLSVRLDAACPAENDWAELEKVFDVAARHISLLKRHKPKEIKHTNDEVVERNLKWDRTLPEGSGQMWWKAFPSPLVPQEQIYSLVSDAPTDTRAKIRADFIREYADTDEIESVGWHRVKRKNKPPIGFKNPYKTSA